MNILPNRGQWESEDGQRERKGACVCVCVLYMLYKAYNKTAGHMQVERNMHNMHKLQKR